ncbi:hypothetical protein O6H91_16G090700 [Diphasiastrum complanatum]|uniref:Uncharacterized protein n=1 Tax=Diphasiastrum complanatum TaxID=34168 RepID=A0ACC2BEL0_DIPCM|nr:hypothetical protein O6H91_16G090700 [Diphasiastrum complanatum]
MLLYASNFVWTCVASIGTLGLCNVIFVLGRINLSYYFTLKVLGQPEVLSHEHTLICFVLPNNTKNGNASCVIEGVHRNGHQQDSRCIQSPRKWQKFCGHRKSKGSHRLLQQCHMTFCHWDRLKPSHVCMLP